MMSFTLQEERVVRQRLSGFPAYEFQKNILGFKIIYTILRVERISQALRLRLQVLSIHMPGSLVY